MLLNKSEEVQFIITLLSYLVNPNQKIYAIKIAHYLYQKLQIQSSEHQFCMELIKLDSAHFFEKISQKLQIQFDYITAQTLPLYELVEQIIRSFSLVKHSNAHVHYFLDEVLAFTQKKTAGIQEFLAYWEVKKEKLSIVSPEGTDAVNIMTIHKSKGLEFPVVIYPFAEQDIYTDQDAQIWVPVEKKKYNDFTEVYLSLTKEVENYGAIEKELINQRDQQLELDSINVLYVALTRPKEQLYIISKKTLDTKGIESQNKYSGLFINHLKQLNKWDDTIDTYEFGTPEKKSKITEIKRSDTTTFISESRLNHNLAIVTKSGSLWDTTQETALEKGNLIHLILSKITYERDVNMVFQEFISIGTISETQQEKLKPIVVKLLKHPKLAPYFKETYQVYNERAILLKNGKTIIPDRVVIANKKATIIDYKTGVNKTAHEEQINTYAAALQEMNYEIDKKILIYLSDTIKIVEVI